MTDLQNTLNKPIISNILGRWIKVSDYGLTEKYRKTSQKVDKEQAIRLINEREKLDKAVKEYQKGEQGISRIQKMEKQLVKDIVGDPPYKGTTKTKATNTKKKFRIAILRGESDERINAVISATTNAEKLTLLGEIKKDMGGEEYITLLRKLHEFKIISLEVGKKAKKL